MAVSGRGGGVGLILHFYCIVRGSILGCISRVLLFGFGGLDGFETFVANGWPIFLLWEAFLDAGEGVFEGAGSLGVSLGDGLERKV